MSQYIPVFCQFFLCQPTGAVPSTTNLDQAFTQTAPPQCSVKSFSASRQEQSPPPPTWTKPLPKQHRPSVLSSLPLPADRSSPLHHQLGPSLYPNSTAPVFCQVFLCQPTGAVPSTTNLDKAFTQTAPPQCSVKSFSASRQEQSLHYQLGPSLYPNSTAPVFCQVFLCQPTGAVPPLPTWTKPLPKQHLPSVLPGLLQPADRSSPLHHQLGPSLYPNSTAPVFCQVFLCQPTGAVPSTTNLDQTFTQTAPPQCSVKFSSASRQEQAPPLPTWTKPLPKQHRPSVLSGLPLPADRSSPLHYQLGPNLYPNSTAPVFCQVFLCQPTGAVPSTTNLDQAFTQTAPPQCSVKFSSASRQEQSPLLPTWTKPLLKQRCPGVPRIHVTSACPFSLYPHMLPHLLIVSSTPSSHSLFCVSHRVIPHIHLITLISVLSIFQSRSALMAHVSHA